MPFDWKTWLGYLSIFSYQCVVIIILGLVVSPFLCFFIGSCILLKPFAEDISNDLILLNQNEKKSNKMDKNMKVKHILSNVIQKFSNVKQLSFSILFVYNDFEEIFLIRMMIKFQIHHWYQSDIWISYHCFLCLDFAHVVLHFIDHKSWIRWVLNNI